MPETLENHVRQFREERGWTQAQLAEEMGVSRKTVNTVENGILFATCFESSARRRAAGDDSASARGISRCHNCSMRGKPRESRFRDSTKESDSSSVSWP